MGRFLATRAGKSIECVVTSSNTETSGGNAHLSRIETEIGGPDWTTVTAPTFALTDDLIRTHSNAGGNSGGQQALSAFRKFGFQLVSVATVQNATTIQTYIDSVEMVSKTEATGRNTRPVATVATRTISEFTSLRHEMSASAKERMPAGV